MSNMISSIFGFLKDRFDLKEDIADESQTTGNIRKDVKFKGINLWTLIFAIMIASIGLNTNSTAVIIGAMLISPIMGPIMGIGLGTATNDFELMRLGFKNLVVAAVISILTSALYFYITPLHEVNSELLARTNPSLWDVLIAFFGGMAGIVAGTRKQPSNVIPGVAIATALMPPLCTAGFGLATGNWMFFFGALYLFFINSIFICLATFLVVKNLGFKKHVFESEHRAKKVKQIIFFVVAVAILPSIYLAYRIVQREIFETNANLYVKNEFVFHRTQVVSKTYKMEGGKKIIDLLLVGQDLSKQHIDSLREKMSLYKLRNTDLIVRQGLNNKQDIDLAQIKASLLEDIFNKEKQQDSLTISAPATAPVYPDIDQELKNLYPDMISYSINNSVIVNLKSGRKDSVALFTAKFKPAIKKYDLERLKNWLAVRIKNDSLKLFIE